MHDVDSGWNDEEDFDPTELDTLFSTGPFSKDLKLDVDTHSEDKGESSVGEFVDASKNYFAEFHYYIHELDSSVGDILYNYLFEKTNINASRLSTVSKAVLQLAVNLLKKEMSDGLLVHSGYKKPDTKDGSPFRTEGYPTVHEALNAIPLHINLRKRPLFSLKRK